MRSTAREWIPLIPVLIALAWLGFAWRQVSAERQRSAENELRADLAASCQDAPGYGGCLARLHM